MNLTRHRMLVATAVAAVVAAAGTGAAFATGVVSTGQTPEQRQAALLEDLADRLGVSVDKLKTAIEGVASDQIDQALADGRLTQEQADELKQRLESSTLLPFGIGSGRGFGFGHHGFGGGLGLDAAADYLGLAAAELRTRLASGKTLAEIAKAEGKSKDGLVQAMVDEHEQRLDAAVDAGRLTADQKSTMLEQMQTRIEAMVDGSLSAGARGMRGMRGMHGKGMGMGMGGRASGTFEPGSGWIG